MKRSVRIALILVAAVSFGVALSYPIMYEWAAKKNNDTMEDLSRMRSEALREATKKSDDAHPGVDTDEDDRGGQEDSSPDRPEIADNQENADNVTGVTETGSSGSTSGQEETDISGGTSGQEGTEISGGISGQEEAVISGSTSGQEETEISGGSSKEEESESSDGSAKKTGSGQESSQSKIGAGEASSADKSETEDEEEIIEVPDIEDFLLDYVPGMTWRQVQIPEYEEHDAPTLLGHERAENREDRSGAVPYTLKEKVKLDEDKILPELKPIYEMNKDLRGWLIIEGTQVDYPVLQRARNNEYYLHRDFFGNDNDNGQLILDWKCDPYTPSYNLVISGHHMRNQSMFGGLDVYKQQSYWEDHKLVTFDTLMRRGTYVIIAAFYSADYDEYEEGFRYNADLRYKRDVDMWLDEVFKNSIYDTDIDAAFGDEFLTLTTCDHTRRDDGRFVLICRRVREGEVFK